mmetsp:Transcript_37436/g.119107  ORF Transcript_37436/g.119107 Transcript_37436/m.119107 type:complete len:209 (+) Transcript_37436:1672-2298(+)
MHEALPNRAVSGALEEARQLQDLVLEACKVRAGLGGLFVEDRKSPAAEQRHELEVLVELGDGLSALFLALDHGPDDLVGELLPGDAPEELVRHPAGTDVEAEDVFCHLVRAVLREFLLDVSEDRIFQLLLRVGRAVGEAHVDQRAAVTDVLRLHVARRPRSRNRQPDVASGAVPGACGGGGKVLAPAPHVARLLQQRADLSGPWQRLA